MNHALSDLEIADSFTRQVNLLKKLIADFLDFPDYAIEIATKIRLFCHDTKNQTSLLSRTKKRDTINFYTQNFTQSGANYKAPFSGLTMMELLIYDGRFIPRALIQNEDISEHALNFDKWWEEIILNDGKGNILSRKNMVLEMADRDGGAHIDAKLTENYHQISKNNSLNWYFESSEISRKKIQGVELSSICQIGIELIASIDTEYKPPEYQRKSMMIGNFSISGIGLPFGKSLPFRMESRFNSPKSDQKNKRCPCKSGKKYKKCHPKGGYAIIESDPIELNNWAL